MYRYAYSLSGEEAVSSDWQNANKSAKLKRVELSCSRNAPFIAIPGMIKMAEQKEIEVASIHIPFSIDTEMGFGSPEERQSHVDFIADFLRKCAPFKCRNFTMHSGPERTAQEFPDRPAAIQLLREGIEKLLPVLKELDCSLNLELLPRTCLGNTPEEIEAMTSGFPEEYIGICLDTNHYNGHADLIPSLVKRFGSRLKTLHLSDCDGVCEAHWLPPQGILDWTAIMQAVREVPQDLLLVLECYGALDLHNWANKRPLASTRIRSMEKTAAILESIDKINWNINF
jgi:sugar phosphate isomerase/epimerase